MKNAEHQILFFIAEQFLLLEPIERLNLGLRLDVIDASALLLKEDVLDAKIFATAYKSGKINKLVSEAEKVLNARKSS